MLTLRGMVALAAGIGLILSAHAALAVTDAEFREAEAAVAKTPGDDAKRVDLARLRYLKGAEFSQPGNHPRAAAEFKAGLAVLEAKPSKVPEQNPVYEETRYGLGYSYLMQALPQDAVVVLDQLVAASPRAGKARYLLGVALIHVRTEAASRRAVEVLGQFGREFPEPDRAMASHAASRFVYNTAIGTALSGKAGDAVQAMSALRGRFGAAGGADAAENQAMQYGMGAFQLLAGNTAAGLAELESLKGTAPSYALKNGVTLAQVLSNTYFKQGLDLLAKGSPESLAQAVTAFENAETNGAGKDADTHHGKALAYKQLKQTDKFEQEMAAILRLDPQYYKKINAGT